MLQSNLPASICAFMIGALDSSILLPQSRNNLDPDLRISQILMKNWGNLESGHPHPLPPLQEFLPNLRRERWEQGELSPPTLGIFRCASI